jgi:hypothetical protein
MKLKSSPAGLLADGEDNNRQILAAARSAVQLPLPTTAGRQFATPPPTSAIPGGGGSGSTYALHMVAGLIRTYCRSVALGAGSGGWGRRSGVQTERSMVRACVR